MHVVLVEPEIPPNTGNIARTCAVTDSTLHLVHPLGFSLDDKYLQRAGLDYWDMVEIHQYQSLEEVINKFKDHNMYFTSKKAVHNYHEIDYKSEDLIFFGRETAGLPEKFLLENLDRSIRIPMVRGARSLNLANSVAVVLYEALRQNQFSGLQARGRFIHMQKNIL